MIGSITTNTLKMRKLEMERIDTTENPTLN
jgi:hypothetical protein